MKNEKEKNIQGKKVQKFLPSWKIIERFFNLFFMFLGCA
jgi:hypothetical protein